MFAGTYAEPVMEALGDIAFQYVFNTEPILKLEIAAETIFRFLLERFTDAALYFDTGRKQSAVQEKLMALISDCLLYTSVTSLADTPIVYWARRVKNNDMHFFAKS